MLRIRVRRLLRLWLRIGRLLLLLPIAEARNTKAAAVLAEGGAGTGGAMHVVVLLLLDSGRLAWIARIGALSWATACRLRQLALALAMALRRAAAALE